MMRIKRKSRMMTNLIAAGKKLLKEHQNSKNPKLPRRIRKKMKKWRMSATLETLMTLTRQSNNGRSTSGLLSKSSTIDLINL